MKRIGLGVATLAGVSAIALSTIATPAFAATDTTSSSAPTERITHDVTVREFVTSGVKVRFTNLTPDGTYQLVFDTTASGGLVGHQLTANAAGIITTKYVARNPGKKHLGQLIGTGYTLALWDGTGAVVSERFAVKDGAALRWDSAHRSGHHVTLRATAERANLATGRFAAWRNAVVKFQEKKGATWTTVKTVRTNGKGVAQATVKIGKHAWRAVLAGTSTTWGAATGTHTK